MSASFDAWKAAELHSTRGTHPAQGLDRYQEVTRLAGNGEVLHVAGDAGECIYSIAHRYISLGPFVEDLCRIRPNRPF